MLGCARQGMKISDNRYKHDFIHNELFLTQLGQFSIIFSDLQNF